MRVVIADFFIRFLLSFCLFVACLGRRIFVLYPMPLWHSVPFYSWTDDTLAVIANPCSERNYMVVVLDVVVGVGVRSSSFLHVCSFVSFQAAGNRHFLFHFFFSISLHNVRVKKSTSRIFFYPCCLPPSLSERVNERMCVCVCEWVRASFANAWGVGLSHTQTQS